MQTRDFLLRAIKIGIVLVFLTPLVLGPFGLNMSEYPKAVFFRSIIEVIFVFYVILILLNPAYLPKKSLLLFAIILFDAILIISSIFGVNFYRSFFGEMQRGEDIILHLHLLAFFIILISVFTKKEDWLWVFKTTVIVSSLSSLAAIFQQLKIFSFYDVDIGRLSGTLSNPDLFGAYIALSIFLAFFLLIAERKKNWKILWVSLIVLNFYTLFFSEVLASWVGAAAGVIFIYLLNYKNLNYKKRIYSLVIVLVVAILLLILPFAIRGAHLEDKSFSMGFSKKILMAYDFNVSGRLPLWQTSFTIFKARPILGWGFESFSFAFDKSFESGYVKSIYFDRPHNKLLEILTAGGIIGIISYFFIFFTLFYLVLKHIKKWDGYNNQQGLLFGSTVLAFFVCGFTQNFFSFDNIGTYILFFLMAGFVNNNFSGLPAANFKKFDSKMPAWKIMPIIFLAFFMLFFMYQINIKPTIAAMYFPASVRYEASSPQTALDGYQRGVDMNTVYNNDLVMAFVDRSIFLLENGSTANGEKIIEGLLNVKPFLYKDIEVKDERPNNVYELLIRTDEWSYMVHKDPSYLSQAQQDTSLAIAFNPNAPVFYELRGDMEILQGKNDDGEKDIRKSCEIDLVGCNGNEAEADKMIGIAYFKKTDYNSAIKNFQKALDANYRSRKMGSSYAMPGVQNFVDSVALMYYNYFKDFESAKRLYEKEMEVYPEYRDIFGQHLNMMTADYESKK